MGRSIGLWLVLLTTVSCQETAPTNTASTEPVPAAPAVWDKAYGGADKAHDTTLLILRNEIAPRFQTLEFKDEVTGKTMTYNLFAPTGYDRNKRYPLVQFIADASTVGKGAEAPLKQGYGGIIWATDESQAANPSFVLVPSFAGPDRAVNDDWELSDEVGIARRLLNDVVARYPIDTNRLYTTGQSMGGMISFYLNATEPDLFAASIFVGSQWNIRVLQPLAQQTFLYIVSAGDEKASNGMRELDSLLTGQGVAFGTTEFSAKLPLAEQERIVAELLAQGHRINFIRFAKGSVTPEGVPLTGAPEHMYSFDHAYQLQPVRDWLFKQRKKGSE
ncbi:MAG: pyrroline-5-carboxylate reductase [Bacteroidetes bacterium]|nr:pyrroline-5-carboxylate reductase [Bacteroidota bacterium]